jgi:hypothetical protein
MTKWTEEGCYPEYHIQGTNFSPMTLLKLIPQLILDEGAHEATDIAKRGRRKDKEYGYGSCRILVPNNEVYPIKYLCNLIRTNRSIFDDSNLDHEVIWIYWIGRQGNMEFTIEQIKSLESTNLAVAMNYIYASDLEIE